jgi:hypothetical protein
MVKKTRAGQFPAAQLDAEAAAHQRHLCQNPKQKHLHTPKYRFSVLRRGHAVSRSTPHRIHRCGRESANVDAGTYRAFGSEARRALHRAFRFVVMA